MTALKKTYPQTTPPEQSSTAPAGRRWPAGPPWSTAYLGDFPVANPVLVLVVHSGACGCCLQCVHPHTRSVWSVWCTRTTEPLALSAAASLMKLACSIGANNFTTPSLQNPSVHTNQGGRMPFGNGPGGHRTSRDMTTGVHHVIYKGAGPGSCIRVIYTLYLSFCDVWEIG